MKILFLTNIPSPYRVDFFNELGKKVELTVLFERHDATDRDEKFYKENFEHFKGIFLNGKKCGSDGTISYSSIWRKEVRKDYNIIICGCYHTYTSMLQMYYMARKKIAYYMSIDGLFIRNESKFKKRIKTSLFKHAKGFFTTGDFSKESIEYYGGKNIHIYPFSSITSNRLFKYDNDRSVNLKKKIGIKEDKKLILSVGQFIERKGFDVLIKALSLVSHDYECLIVGGENKEKYLELANRYHLDSVHFLKFLPFDELLEYYKAADLFILPTREDTWGLVINEAIANSLPVITTTKCLAGLELVSEENGALYDPEDYTTLANLINKFLNMKQDELLKYRQASFTKAQKYTTENMVNEHLNIIESELNHEN